LVRKLRFVQADVFSDSPFGGNPVVVVPEGGPLSGNEMQSLARGMNFAETAFVLPAPDPATAFALRCFTPTTEVAYSGHSLLGATFVLALEGRIAVPNAGGEVRVALGRTSYPVTVQMWGEEVGRLAFLERPAEFGAVLDDEATVAAALSLDPLEILQTGLPIEVVRTGLSCLVVPVASLAALRALMPVAQNVAKALQPLEAVCLLAFTRQTLSPANDVHVRVFAPSLGIPEDPATGSANGALAAYLVRHEAIETQPVMRLRSEQGSELGRPSVIELEVDATGEGLSIRVGGRVARSVEGTVFY
jgi:trans-2,3-dihydro-3-hydroxyanthranilate isomerase